MPTDEPLTKSDRNKLESSLGNASTFDPLTEQGGLHCLEVFRRSLLAIRTGPKPTPRIWIKRWSHTNRVADKRRQQLIHCVTDLKDAGIKFKRRKTDRFWDIKFKNGILKIPRLLIHDELAGSDAEVADLFNRLCQEVVFDINDSSLSRLSEQVNRYYDHRWNAWRATLRHKYFNNPWSIVSFFAAVVLLALTFAQTFYSVYGYYTPHS
ncbi:UNVERIFIED_CONTAM: hypothetical protein Sradi_4220600 [Sesamum radiatum]|uniref:Uncharacterized protein n=1 Tax=Sesamum radiatum TaxID=300843 RepID=A0AAW2P4E3_SESRA